MKVRRAGTPDEISYTSSNRCVMQVVLERLGRFSRVLTPGLHFVLPWIDRPKQYSVKYYINDAHGNLVTVQRTTHRIDTSDQVRHWCIRAFCVSQHA